MLQWKQVYGILAAGAVVLGLAVAPAPASAQQTGASAPVANAQQRPVLRARELMTPAERQSYRQAIRAARNDPARKQQLREQWMSTLHARAAQRGGVLAQPGMNRPAQKEARNSPAAQREPARPAARPANLPPRAP